MSKCYYLFLFLLAVLMAYFFSPLFEKSSSNSKSKPVSLKTSSLHCGVYYYLWYPKNFSKGILRRELRPRQKPMLGFYSSDSMELIKTHIRWCSNSGIDFMALNYWPSRPEQNALIWEKFLHAPNLKDISFCLFYETWNLGFDRDHGIMDFDASKRERFLEDFQRLKDLFKHPSYFKIEGRPLVILYLTRVLGGLYKEAIEDLRSMLLKEGVELFLIGDEIFWDVSQEKGLFHRVNKLAGKPNFKRARLFDGITCYNYYESNYSEQGGYGGESAYFDQVSRLNKLYKEGLSSVAFVPSVIPGYNDRGVRPREDHFVIPRRLSKGEEGGSFFQEALKRMVLHEIRHFPLFMVTSFNEWSEDTAIEPLELSESTNDDKSGDQNYFSKGYSYEGYEFKYLSILRDFLCLFAGQIDSQDTGWQGKKMEVVDSNGNVYGQVKLFSDGTFIVKRNLAMRTHGLSFKLGDDLYTIPGQGDLEACRFLHVFIEKDRIVQIKEKNEQRF